MAQLIYLMCAATSIACAVLLLRANARRHIRLLFWSGLCFCGLAVNNILLVIDKEVVPARDLSLLRSATALLSACLLLFGLMWESQ